MSDSHYSLLASHHHHHHQQAYSNKTAGIGKRPRGRPRLNEATSANSNNTNSNKNGESNSKHSISKSLIQSLLAKSPSSSCGNSVDSLSWASLISRIPGLDHSLSSTSLSSATTVMKRGRGRPKSIKTILKEAKMAGLEIPSDVIKALMVNQQQRQRAHHSHQQHESTNYYSNQHHHESNHHRLSHSESSQNQHLHPSTSLHHHQSYSCPNQSERGLIPQHDQTNNIQSHRPQPPFSYHQYQSKQQQQSSSSSSWMDQQQQNSFSSLSENVIDNFNHHQQSILEEQYVQPTRINSQHSNVAITDSMLFSMNNNNNNKIIGQCETEIVKNPFDDLDDPLPTTSSSSNHLSIKSNDDDVEKVAPIRISLTKNSMFHCSSAATQSISTQQEQELQSQLMKRKRLNFSANPLSDNDDDNAVYSGDDDSNESSYSTPSSFYDDDDDDSYEDDRGSYVINKNGGNKRRKHQHNGNNFHFFMSKSSLNNSIHTDTSRKSNHFLKRQQYTLTGKPKFTESIMMDCLNTALINDNDDDINDELFNNLDFYENDDDDDDDDNSALKKIPKEYQEQQQEDTPKLPKLLLKRLNTDDHGFKIIQNDDEIEKEIEMNNNQKPKSETVKKLTIRLSTNGEASIDHDGDNSVEKFICNKQVEQICDSKTEDTQIITTDVKSIDQISDDKDNNCCHQVLDPTEVLVDHSKQHVFENDDIDNSTTEAVTSNPLTSILNTEPVDENPLFRTPSPPPAFDHSLINSTIHPSSLSSSSAHQHLSSVESILPINCLDTAKLISDNEQFSAINSIMNLDDFERTESPSQEIEINPLISNQSKNLVDDSNNSDNVNDQNEDICIIGTQEEISEQSTDLINGKIENILKSPKNTEIETTTESFVLQEDQTNETKIESSDDNENNALMIVTDSCKQQQLNKDLIDTDASELIRQLDMKTLPPNPTEESIPLTPHSSPQHIQSTANSILIPNTTENTSTASVSMPTPIQSIPQQFTEPQINSLNIQQPPLELQPNLPVARPVMISQTSVTKPLQQPLLNSVQIQHSNPSSVIPPHQQQHLQPRLPLFQLPSNSAIRLFTPSVDPQIQHPPSVHPHHNARQTFLFQSAGQNLGFHTQTQQPQFMIRSPFIPTQHQPSLQHPQMIRTQAPNGSTINLILPNANAHNPYGYTARPPPQASAALINPAFSNSITQPMFIRNGPRLIPVNSDLMNTMRILAPGQPLRPNNQTFFTMAAPISSSQHLMQQQQQQQIRQHQQQVSLQQQQRFTSTPIFLSSPITNQKVILESKPPPMIKEKLDPPNRQLPIKDILTEAMEEIRFYDIDDQPDNNRNQQPKTQPKMLNVTNTIPSPSINPNNPSSLMSAIIPQSLIRSSSQVLFFSYFFSIIITNLSSFYSSLQH